MKKTTLISSLLAVLFFGCNKEELQVAPNTETHGEAALLQHHEPSGSCDPVITDFYAGQHTLAGEVAVSNDENNIYVTINTKDGWMLKLTHLFVGALEDLPRSSMGNPKIGNFPYQTAHSPYVNSFTYSVPLSEVGDDSCLVVATHAEVKLVDENGEELRGETAWAAGTQMADGGSWASYFDYCKCSGTSSNDNSDSTNDGTNDNDGSSDNTDDTSDNTDSTDSSDNTDDSTDDNSDNTDDGSVWDW